MNPHNKKFCEFCRNKFEYKSQFDSIVRESKATYDRYHHDRILSTCVWIVKQYCKEYESFYIYVAQVRAAATSK